MALNREDKDFSPPLRLLPAVGVDDKVPSREVVCDALDVALDPTPEKFKIMLISCIDSMVAYLGSQ